MRGHKNSGSALAQCGKKCSKDARLKDKKRGNMVKTHPFFALSLPKGKHDPKLKSYNCQCINTRPTKVTAGCGEPPNRTTKDGLHLHLVLGTFVKHMASLNLCSEQAHVERGQRDYYKSALVPVEQALQQCANSQMQSLGASLKLPDLASQFTGTDSSSICSTRCGSCGICFVFYISDYLCCRNLCTSCSPTASFCLTHASSWMDRQCYSN